jgi:hypothetical protein
MEAPLRSRGRREVRGPCCLHDLRLSMLKFELSVKLGNRKMRMTLVIYSSGPVRIWISNCWSYGILRRNGGGSNERDLTSVRRCEAHAPHSLHPIDGVRLPETLRTESMARSCFITEMW